MEIRTYNVTELSADELQRVTGGESLWYYVGFAIGFVAGSLEAWGEGAAQWAEMNTTR